MAGPGAAAGAKAAGAAAGRVGGGAASRSGAAQAAKGAGAGGAGGAARSGGGGGGAGGGSDRASGGGSGQGPSLGKLIALRPPRRREKGEGDQSLFGSTLLKLLALGGGGLTFFLLVIIAPLSLFEASANSCLGEGDEAVPIQTNHKSDPEDLSETQIAIRIYLVGQVMKMTPRQIVTAYDVAFVESTMTNIYGGDRDSTGVFQQRNFSPWTDGGRNRNNVIDSSIAFFLQLRRLDRGQPIPVLAQDVQVSAYPERYGEWVDEAVALYDETRRLVGSAAGVKTIQSLQGVTIGGGGLDALSLGAACSALTAAGPANLKKAVTHYQPRSYKTLPADVWAGAGPAQQVDTRIWANAVWVMRTYRLKATAAREAGHKTHGDGTALDMAPAEGNSQRVWDSTARQLALDLGWTPGCASSGYSAAAGGACNFAPAIILVGYNGFDDNHGDPAHTHLPHIHVSWFNSCYGCGGGALVSPRAWVKAFPVGVGSPETPGKGGKRARKA